MKFPKLIATISALTVASSIGYVSYKYLSPDTMNRHEHLEYLKTRQILDMDFDKDKILNKVNKKEYTTTENTPNYIESAISRGIQFKEGFSVFPISDMTDYGLKESVTVSFWFKPNDYKGGIIYFSDDSEYNTYGVFYKDGQIGFNTRSGDLYGTQIDKNSYSHVVAIFKNNISESKIFINGEKRSLSNLDADTAPEHKTYLNSKTTVRVGSTGNTSAPETLNNSVLDELHVWNREVSDKEVDSLWLQQKNARNRVDAINKMRVKITFDKNKVENELNGKIYPTENKGQFVTSSHNKGFQFFGDQITIPITDIGSIDDEWITLNFYMSLNHSENYVMPVSIGNYSLYINKEFDSNSNTITNYGFNTFNSDIYGMDYFNYAGNSHYTTLIFNTKDITKSEIYISGVKQKLTQRLGSPNPNNLKLDDYITISGSGDGYRLSNSIMDEITIYNGRLVPSQIDERYAQQYNPRNKYAQLPSDSATRFGKVAHFDFNSEVKNNMTNITYNQLYSDRTPEYVSGVRGNALKANGNQFQIPLSDLKIDSSTRNVTTAFWVKFSDDSENNEWLMPVGFENYDLIYYKGPGKMFGFNTDAGDLRGINNTSVDMHNSDWHYVVAVWDSEDISQNRLYIDGYEQELTQLIGNPNPNNMHFTKANNFCISGFGRENYSSYKMINTLIDELTIYNRALTQEEAKYLFDSQFNVPRPEIRMENKIPKVSWTSPENIELFRDGERIYEGNSNSFLDRDFLSKFKSPIVSNLTYNISLKDGKYLLESTFDSSSNNELIEADYSIRTKNSILSNFTYSKEFEFKPTIEGYSYILDAKPDTIPDDIIETNVTNIVIDNIVASEDLYLHVKAIDNINHSSNVLHAKIELPMKPIKLTLESLNTNPTNKDVPIKVSVLNDSNLDYIQMPDGQKIYSNTATYLASSNGLYSFIAFSLDGRFDLQSIVIENIDKTNPTINISKTPDDNWTNTDIDVHISSND